MNETLDLIITLALVAVAGLFLLRRQWRRRKPTVAGSGGAKACSSCGTCGRCG